MADLAKRKVEHVRHRVVGGHISTPLVIHSARQAISNRQSACFHLPQKRNEQHEDTDNEQKRNVSISSLHRHDMSGNQTDFEDLPVMRLSSPPPYAIAGLCCNTLGDSFVIGKEEPRVRSARHRKIASFITRTTFSARMLCRSVEIHVNKKVTSLNFSCKLVRRHT